MSLLICQATRPTHCEGPPEPYQQPKGLDIPSAALQLEDRGTMRALCSHSPLPATALCTIKHPRAQATTMRQPSCCKGCRPAECISTAALFRAVARTCAAADLCGHSTVWLQPFAAAALEPVCADCWNEASTVHTHSNEQLRTHTCLAPS
jgi:hypothetical protein